MEAAVVKVGLSLRALWEVHLPLGLRVMVLV
jgi:hypothetical protein